jgi:tetratricopeptide (TPR) repeat protein
MVDWNRGADRGSRWLAALLAVIVMAPGGAGAQGRTGSQTEAQQSLREANAAQKRGKADEAAALYRKAIQLDPRLFEAYERLSMNLFARKRFSEGERLVRKGLDLMPDNEALKAQLGMHLYKMGKAKEAHKLLKGGIAAFPSRFEIQATASQCCLAVEDYSCAVKGLRNFLAHRPKALASRDHLILTMMGSAYLRKGDLRDARRVLNKVLRKRPDHVPARLAMAEVLLESGDCSRAVAAFEAIRSKAKGGKGFHLLLGRAYLCNRRLREALREVSAHLSRRPNAVGGLVLRGDINVQLRRYAAALADYRKAARLGKKEELHIKIAQVHMRQRRYRKALSELEPAARSPGASLDVLVLAVRAAMKSKQKKKALELSDRLLKLPERDARAYYFAGIAHSSVGKFERAIELYAEALKDKPRHHGARRETVKALSYLARGQLKKNKLKEALAYMERARKVSPGSLVVNRNLALLRLRLGNHRGALKALKPVLRKTPNDLVANRMAGRARLELGQHKQAAAHFDRAVASVLRHGGMPLARALAESGVTHLWLGRTRQALMELQRALKLAAAAKEEPDAATFMVQIKQNIARAHVISAKEAMAADKPQKTWAEIQLALEASASLPPAERSVVEASAAVCALTVGQVARAQKLLGKLKGKVNKVLAAPYNKVGGKLLAAYSDYLSPDPRAKQRASKQLAWISRRMPRAARGRLLTLAVSAQEQAAVLYYRRGKRPQARQALARAKALSKRPPSAAHRHNVAVLAYVTGKRNAAVGTLDAVKGRVPLALCNLAVHHERSGSMLTAYELFRECKRRGAAYPRLDNIVEAKQRIFGGER